MSEVLALMEGHCGGLEHLLAQGTGLAQGDDVGVQRCT